MNAQEALEKAIHLPGASVLDIGCGDESHANAFRKAGKTVTTVSLRPPANYVSDYLLVNPGKFDIIWCSHCLEHQLNPNVFLKKAFDELNDCGWMVVTVPPAKDELVGGHVSIWNESILLYHLVLAGFDCSRAKVKRYGYNISVIVQKIPAKLPALSMDFGDIQKLEPFFPGLKHGDIAGDINWDD